MRTSRMSKVWPIVSLGVVTLLAPIGCHAGQAAQGRDTTARSRIRQSLGEVPPSLDPTIAHSLSNTFRSAAAEPRARCRYSAV